MDIYYGTYTQQMESYFYKNTKSSRSVPEPQVSSTPSFVESSQPIPQSNQTTSTTNITTSTTRAIPKPNTPSSSNPENNKNQINIKVRY